MQSKTKQEAYRELVTEIVQRVRAKEFAHYRDVLTAYGRSRPSFCTKIKRAAIRFNFISELDWDASFSKRFRRTVKHTCPSCGHTWQPPKSKTVR